ncbi:hypothetical protein QOT17_003863 [Balamuthia mandrillaris]
MVHIRSLFEQTVAELHLLRYVNTLLSEYSCADETQLLEALDKIFGALEDTRGNSQSGLFESMSAHSVELLRGQALNLGYALLHKTSTQNKTQQESGGEGPLLDLQFEESEPLVQAQQETSAKEKKERINLFFLRRLMRTRDAFWGSTLIQPEVKDLFTQYGDQQSSWLELVFNDDTQAPDASLGRTCTEQDYLAILAQIPWIAISEVGGLNWDDLKRCILVPLQRGIAVAVGNRHLRLLIMLAKIIALVACIFPSQESVLEAVRILTTNTNGLTAASYPVLKLLPWHCLSPTAIISIFASLYSLSPPESVAAYASLLEGERTRHRQAFLQSTLRQHKLLRKVYKLEPQLGVAVSQSRAPLFSIFSQLSQLFIKPAELTHLQEQTSTQTEQGPPQQTYNLDLERLVVEELSYYACMIRQTAPVQSSPTDSKETKQSTLLESIQQDALDQLCTLCVHSPGGRAIGHVVHWAGHNLPSVNTASITRIFTIASQEAPSITKWDVDLNSLNWMAYFLTHCNPPACESSEIVSSWINTFLVAPPQVQFPAQASVNGITIGSKMVELINWRKCNPLMRMKALLVVLASKPLVNANWLWDTILGPVGRSLISGPFPDGFVEQFMHLDSSDLKCADEVAAVQLFLTLELAISKLKPKDESDDCSKGDRGLKTLKWLHEWGFFIRLQSLSRKELWPAFRQVLLRYISTITLVDVVKCSKPLAGFVLEILERGKKSEVEEMQQIMLSSLSELQGHEACVQLWATVLLPKIPRNKAATTMLDKLVHGSFCERSSIAALSQIIPSKQWDTSQLFSLNSSGHPWIAYALLLCYQPKVSNNSDHSPKETALWVAKELALSNDDPVAALPFWEQFWIIYFSAGSQRGAEWLELEKPALNQHFTRMAQFFENAPRQRAFYKLYYSFTIWNAEIIREGGGFFSSIEILSTFVDILPPAWSVNYAAAPCDLTIPLNNSSEKPSTNRDALLAILLSLMPEPKPLDSESSGTIPQHRSDGNAVCRSLQMSLQQTVNAILLLASSTQATRPQIKRRKDLPSLPIVNELQSLLMEYHNLCKALQEQDQEFLSISSQLYANLKHPFKVRVPCGRGKHCSNPARVQGTSTYIGEGVPNARETLEENRQQYSDMYNNFFEIARSLAKVVVVLQDVKQWLLQDPPPAPDAAAHFFLGVLPAVLDTQLPVNSPISTSIINALQDVGKAFIQDNVLWQEPFLRFLLRYSRRWPYPRSMDQQPPPPQQQHIQLDSQVTPGSSTDQPKQAQRPGIAFRIFYETRAHLFSLLTPNVFLSLNSGESSRWFTLLRMVVDTLPPTFAHSDDTTALGQPPIGGNKRTGLSEEELSLLVQQFDLSNYFAELESSNMNLSDAFVNSMLDILPKMLQRSALTPQACKLLRALLNFRMPDHLLAVLQSPLLHQEDISAVSWEDVFDALAFDGITLRQTQRIFTTMISCLPLPIRTTPPILLLARRVFNAPPFLANMASEVRAYCTQQETHVEMDYGPSWRTIEDLIAAALNFPLLDENNTSQTIYTEHLPPSTVQDERGSETSTNLTSKVLERVIQIIHDATLAVPELVDRVWYLYQELLSPHIDLLPLWQQQSLADWFHDLPWSNATFHQRDLSTLKHMHRHALLSAHHVVCVIFRRLSWSHLLNFAEEAQTGFNSAVLLVDTEGTVTKEQQLPSISQSSLEAQHLGALYYLRLYLLLNLLQPDVKQSSLLEDSEQSDSKLADSLLGIDWPSIPGPFFERIFDGTALLDPMRTKGCLRRIDHDPSEQIMENALMLRDIVLQMKSPIAAAACLREIRSLLFFCIQNKDDSKQTWHLSYPEHIALLTSVLIPLSRRFAEESSRVASQMILFTLSCIEAEWQGPVLPQLAFYNSNDGVPVRPSTAEIGEEGDVIMSIGAGLESGESEKGESRAKMFYQTLTGIVMQFCASASPSVAIEILNVASSVVTSMPTLCRVYEEALHAYFGSHASHTPSLLHATASMQPPSIPWEKFLGACSQTPCSLTLRVVLEQKHRLLSRSSEDEQWLKFVSIAVRAVVGFKPDPNKEFEVFVLWFFIIELALDRKWRITRATNQVAEVFLKYLQGWYGAAGSSSSRLMALVMSVSSTSRPKIYTPKQPTKPNMHLAGRACSIFFRRVLCEKDQPNTSSSAKQSAQNVLAHGSGETLAKELDELLLTQEDFPEYSSFYEQVDSILSPLTTFQAFVEGTVSTLVPIAPYLAAIQSSSSSSS